MVARGDGSDQDRVCAVVVAAGAGQRFAKEGPPKQYWDLCGEPILRWSLRPFLANPRVKQVVVVLPAADVEAPPDWLAELAVQRVPGGAQRSDSVRNGLAALDPTLRTVLV